MSNDGKKVTDYYITKHGIEHEQYFQGHGIALTQWQDCATGVGTTELEAFDDALESLAQNGWDVSGIVPETLTGEECYRDLPEGCWIYVSVDVTAAKAGCDCGSCHDHNADSVS